MKIYSRQERKYRKAIEAEMIKYNQTIQIFSIRNYKVMHKVYKIIPVLQYYESEHCYMKNE